jgi:hypothetical protein
LQLSLTRDSRHEGTKPRRAARPFVEERLAVAVASGIVAAVLRSVLRFIITPFWVVCYWQS